MVGTKMVMGPLWVQVHAWEDCTYHHEGAPQLSSVTTFTAAFSSSLGCGVLLRRLPVPHGGKHAHPPGGECGPWVLGEEDSEEGVSWHFPWLKIYQECSAIPHLEVSYFDPWWFDLSLRDAAEEFKGQVLWCLQLTFKWSKKTFVERDRKKEKMLTTAETQENIEREKERERKC